MHTGCDVIIFPVALCTKQPYARVLHLDCVTGSVVGRSLSGLRQPGDVTGSWQGITGIPPPDGMVIILTVMCLSEKAPIPASKDRLY